MSQGLADARSTAANCLVISLHGAKKPAGLLSLALSSYVLAVLANLQPPIGLSLSVMRQQSLPGAECLGQDQRLMGTACDPVLLSLDMCTSEQPGSSPSMFPVLAVGKSAAARCFVIICF